MRNIPNYISSSHADLQFAKLSMHSLTTGRCSNKSASETFIVSFLYSKEFPQTVENVKSDLNAIATK